MQRYVYETCDDGDYVLLISEEPHDIVVHQALLVQPTDTPQFVAPDLAAEMELARRYLARYGNQRGDM